MKLFEGLDEDGGGELSLQAFKTVFFASAHGLRVTDDVQDLDDEEGNLYWSFQEFCVLKFRKGVEERHHHVMHSAQNPS